MPIETDVVAYLAGAGLGLTAGTILFEGPSPEQDECVAVTHYASQESDDFTMGPSLSAPGSELESFQVMTRHVVKATATTRALAIHAVLDNLGTTANFGGSGLTYFHIRSDGPPTNLGQDQELRWRLAANYHARKARG